MPLLGATLDSASIDATYKIVTCTGTNFGEVQAPVCDIETSLTGAGSWTSVDSIDSWGNLEAVGSYSTALAAGTYDVRLITGDDRQLTIIGAFEIKSGSAAILYEKIYTF